CCGGPLISADSLDLPLPFLTDLRAGAQGFIIEALVEPGDRIFSGRFVPAIPEPIAPDAADERPRDRERNYDGEPASEGKPHPNLSDPAFLDGVAGCKSRAGSKQRRALILAARVGERATRMEGAALGRIEGIGDLALHWLALPAGHFEIRHRIEQH